MFGEIVDGMNVIDMLERVATDRSDQVGITMFLYPSSLQNSHLCLIIVMHNPHSLVQK